MNKNISWWVLCLVGLVLHFGGPFVGGVVGDFVGVGGDIIFLLGVVNGIVLLFKKKRQ